MSKVSSHVCSEPSIYSCCGKSWLAKHPTIGLELATISSHAHGRHGTHTHTCHEHILLWLCHAHPRHPHHHIGAESSCIGYIRCKLSSNAYASRLRLILEGHVLHVFHNLVQLGYRIELFLLWLNLRDRLLLRNLHWWLSLIISLGYLLLLR